VVLYKRGEYEIRTCRICKKERSKAYYWDKLKAEKHPGKRGRPRIGKT
jgi:hypothetical protein